MLKVMASLCLSAGIAFAFDAERVEQYRQMTVEELSASGVDLRQLSEQLTGIDDATLGFKSRILDALRQQSLPLPSLETIKMLVQQAKENEAQIRSNLAQAEQLIIERDALFVKIKTDIAHSTK